MKRFPDSIGWGNWGGLMCDEELFAPLVAEVLARCGLPARAPSAGFPGTHAVFLTGDAVIKLYAPLGLPDAEIERAAYRAAAAAGVPRLPRLLGEGEIEREGRTWPFIALSKVVGSPTRECWPALSAERRNRVAAAAGEWMAGYHGLADPLPAGHPLGRHRWPGEFDRLTRKNADRLLDAGWPAALVEELLRAAAGLRGAKPVWVHGDLTEDHLLVDGDNLSIIDLADSRMAPAQYEWPALLFGGLRGDYRALNACAAAAGLPAPGAPGIAASAMIHLYGAPILLGAPGDSPPADFDALCAKIAESGR
ncbi:MAG: aminoglycoside phosphotransferase family protein [Clostridiales bacterium]|nr:aminoglycoside phosphotransferase family protein [Clostridiales bacterium]